MRKPHKRRKRSRDKKELEIDDRVNMNEISTVKRNLRVKPSIDYTELNSDGFILSSSEGDSVEFIPEEEASNFCSRSNDISRSSKNHQHIHELSNVSQVSNTKKTYEEKREPKTVVVIPTDPDIEPFGVDFRSLSLQKSVSRKNIFESSHVQFSPTTLRYVPYHVLPPQLDFSARLTAFNSSRK